MQLISPICWFKLPQTNKHQLGQDGPGRSQKLETHMGGRDSGAGAIHDLLPPREHLAWELELGGTRTQAQAPRDWMWTPQLSLDCCVRNTRFSACFHLGVG